MGRLFSEADGGAVGVGIGSGGLGTGGESSEGLLRASPTVELDGGFRDAFLDARAGYAWET